MDPNQQPQNNIPSIKQPGNWSPLNDYSNDVTPPPKKSFLKEYRKLIIISAIAVILLIGLAVASSLTSNQNGEQVSGPTTNVAQTTYDGEIFSMNYAEGLKIDIDQNSDDGTDRYLLLTDDVLAPTYRIEVYVTDEKPFYFDSQEGLREQQDLGVEINNIVTSDVALAGSSTQKSVGEITGSDGTPKYVQFAMVQVGDKYVVVTAEYAKDNANIHDSFDSMIGSIKLK